MKKLIYVIVAALLVCGPAIAQEKKEKEKKSGGFMKALKKGVESTTGLRVSDETLFVYPTVGEWKMNVETCVGNKNTGEVILTIKVTKLTGDAYQSTFCMLEEAMVTGGERLGIRGFSAEPLYTFSTAEPPVIVTFAPITGVPVDTKAIDVKFKILHHLFFEARRAPIEWTE